MKKTPIISSSKHYLHHHLKPHHKPLTTITPPDDLITKLTTTDDWTNLHHQITSLPQQSILKIAKQFTTSSKAFKFFNFINNPSSPTSSFVFQTVLQLATREKDPIFIDNLYQISKEMNVSLTPMSAIIIMKHLFRVKTVQECVKMYDGLNPDGKTVDVKNVLLDLLLKCDRFNDAHQLLDEMLQPDGKVLANEMTLNVVFPVLLRWDYGKECDKFVDLLPRFGVLGVFPDSVWLTKLVTKLCRGYKNDKAWELLCELMKFGKVEAAPCNALLSGLGKEWNYERINLLLKGMKENGTEGIVVKPDVILYNTLIDGLCKVGRQEEGLELMKQMMLDGSCVPSVMSKNGVDQNVITVNTLVDGMCKHGRIGNAMEFFRKMQEEKGIKGNVVTYSTLISAFCTVNNIEKSMSLFDEMESVGSPDALAYYSLISGLTLAGRPDDASVIASKLKKAGFRMDLTTYNTLIGGFCRRKKLEKAVELLKEMEETGVKADGVTYNTLISYFCKNGDFESAYKFLKQMIIDGHVPTVITCSTLIHAYCLAGNLDEALKGSSQYCYLQYLDQHSLQTCQNKLRIALRLMDQMTSQSCNPDYVTMEILNDWLSAVGETEKLRKFVQGYQVSSVASNA
ncbi:pentatricopeptide repeat-containing protein [Tanacetum coccineum]